VAERYGLLFAATNGATDTLYTGATAETLAQGKSISMFPASITGTPCAVAFGSAPMEYVATLDHFVYSSYDFTTFYLFVVLSYAPSGIAVDQTHGFVCFSHNTGNSIDIYDTNANYLGTMN